MGRSGLAGLHPRGQLEKLPLTKRRLGRVCHPPDRGPSGAPSGSCSWLDLTQERLALPTSLKPAGVYCRRRGELGPNPMNFRRPPQER